MKADEIIFRQNRVVYTLMILLAGLGLVWSLWQHRHNTAGPVAAPAATQSVPAGHAATPTAVLSR